MKRLVSSLILLVFGLISVPIPKALAVGNSITISPAQVDIELSTTDATKQTTFTIGNSYNVPVVLSIELMGIDQQAGRVIPSADIDQSLVDSVRLSATELTIPEQSAMTVSLIITNSSQLPPGGHYGTIVFTQRKTGNEEVSLTQAISVGLFVVKRGGQLREVDAGLFTSRSLPFQIPSSSELSIKNVGNVHVIPRAGVLVYAKNNDLIAKGVANTESRRVLPGKTYEEKITIQHVKKLWWPQKLKIVLEYRADGIEEAKTISKNIVYIPAYVVPVSICIVLLMIISVRYKLTHKKKKRIPQAIELLGEESLLGQSAVTAESIVTVKQTIPNKPKKRVKKPKKIEVDTP